MNTLTLNVTILQILGLIVVKETNPSRYINFLYRLILYFLLTLSVLDLLNFYTRSISLINFVDIFPVAHISVSAWFKATIFIFINRKIQGDLLPMTKKFQRYVKIEIFLRKLHITASLISIIPLSIALLQPRVNLNGNLIPFHSSLPFNYYNDSQYIVAYIYQSICSFYVIFIDFQISFFLISLFIHCSHQLRVSQENFKKIIKQISMTKMEINFKKNQMINWLPVKINFRKTVKHHAHILW